MRTALVCLGPIWLRKVSTRLRVPGWVALGGLTAAVTGLVVISATLAKVAIAAPEFRALAGLGAGPAGVLLSVVLLCFSTVSAGVLAVQIRNVRLPRLLFLCASPNRIVVDAALLPTIALVAVTAVIIGPQLVFAIAVLASVSWLEAAAAYVFVILVGACGGMSLAMGLSVLARNAPQIPALLAACISGMSLAALSSGINLDTGFVGSSVELLLPGIVAQNLIDGRSELAYGAALAWVVVAVAVNVILRSTRRTLQLQSSEPGARIRAENLNGWGALPGELVRLLRIPSARALVMSAYLMILIVVVPIGISGQSSRAEVLLQLGLLSAFGVCSFAVCSRGALGGLYPAALLHGMSPIRWSLAVVGSVFLLVFPGVLVASIALIAWALPFEMVMVWVAVVAYAGVCGLLAGFVLPVEADSAVQITAVTGAALVLLFATVNVIRLGHTDLGSHAMVWILSGLGVGACVVREKFRWSRRDSANERK